MARQINAVQGLLFFRLSGFLYVFSRIPYMEDRPVAKPLPAKDNTNIEEAHTHDLSAIRIRDPNI
jgi:hypothetical protein